MDFDKIVLFAKQPGQTSFSSLFTIKHALGTQKAGHTGTLDSFASGLLVVCAGSLTRIASRITEFDKEYEAVLQFGAETDTLECTGSVVRTAALPSKKNVEAAVSQFSGTLMQRPPLFSAIHIDGKRASDIARSGKSAEMPERQITVYNSKILEWKCNEDGAVSAVRILFNVSKGTYIRSLARDIGAACGSAAHLAGLYRTRVGSFSVENAAGFDLLPDFTIESALQNAETLCAAEKRRAQLELDLKARGIPRREWKSYMPDNREGSPAEELLQRQVCEKAYDMNRQIAVQCGFACLTVRKDMENVFRNGGKLRSAMFDVSPFTLQEDFAAVFTSDERFAGLLQKDCEGYFGYAFVNSSFGQH